MELSSSNQSASQDSGPYALSSEQSPANTTPSAGNVHEASQPGNALHEPIRDRHSLTIDTINSNPCETESPDPENGQIGQNFSETSSEVPTSARLSIATTTQAIFPHGETASHHGDHNSRSVGRMLDDILANPGWDVGRQRRHSLHSMRSLQPTLPPYEEYRNHASVQMLHRPGEAGPSNAYGRVHDFDRSQAGIADEKRRPEEGSEVANDVRSSIDEARAIDHDTDPLNTISAHYSRIVRTIDSRYTDELARLHAEIDRLKADNVRELARVRNDMDAKYRSELRERDKGVEKAREEMASNSAELEQDVLSWKAKCDARLKEGEELARQSREEAEEMHTRDLEKAKHQVEDMWERRWRDRFSLERQESWRKVQKRDEEWLTFLRSECPHIVDVAEATMALSSTSDTET